MNNGVNYSKNPNGGMVVLKNNNHSTIMNGLKVDNVVQPFQPFNHYDNKREELLDFYKGKQPFRVSIGKATWLNYESFNPAYNLREILNDEIVIEFEYKTDWNKNWEAINETGINLFRAGYSFEIWNHEGKSPHLHIHNLPIAELTAEKRKLFKKIFIRTYVPKEHLAFVDITLTGIHLIAIEWAKHWKGCAGVKELLHKFEPKGEPQ